MTQRPIKDLSASVRQRLLNNAKQTDRPFQEVLQYFAMERFLYRLARSRHADGFVLKGALMFAVWRAPASRATKDIDLLARMDNSVDAVVMVMRDVCCQEVEADGIVFDVASLHGRVIKEGADYEGVRLVFHAYLQNARVQMQIDVGFGDVVVPAATIADYPTILDLPAPRLYGYCRETVVAEKFEAMVKLGQLNSRMKDFFDLWLLSRQFDFDGATLGNAIATIFAHRQTEVTAQPLALTPAFTTDPAKTMQWRGFLRKARLHEAPTDLAEVIEALAVFLVPIATAICSQDALTARWSPPGPWSGLSQ